MRERKKERERKREREKQRKKYTEKERNTEREREKEINKKYFDRNNRSSPFNFFRNHKVVLIFRSEEHTSELQSRP